MKILFFTDVHISHKKPASRIDNYSDAIKSKLNEIVEKGNKFKVDVLICGGDLFHSPTPSPNSVMVANDIAQILRKSNAPIYVVPGNHDEFGYNVETLPRTLLGIYEASGIVKRLDRGNCIEHKLQSGQIINIEGQEYHSKIDNGDASNFTCSNNKDLNILVSHAMVTSSKITTHYKKVGVNHIDLKDVSTNADIVLTGHEHNGYGIKKIGNTTFANPGSIGRTDNTLKHTPKFIIIDVMDNLSYNLEEVELECASYYDEIFNPDVKEEKLAKNNNLEAFEKEIDSILNRDGESTNLKDIIKETLTEYAKSNDEEFDEVMYNNILSMIQDSDEELAVNDMIVKNYKLQIVEVNLTNFQSHKNSTVYFTNGLNSIIGESDSGKTAILRAIAWCLYNNRKGTDFIRTGAKEVSVTVKFNDGSEITRQRNSKNSGEYIVKNSKGEVKEFKGFNNNIPSEIVNEHQMPNINVSKDLEVNINIANQLDRPFLLCETSSVKAAAIGKITKTDLIDLASKNTSSEIKSIQKSIKAVDKLIDDKKIELEEFIYLESEKRTIEKLEKLFQELDKKSNELQEISKIKDKITSVNANIENVKSKLSSTIDFKIASVKIEDIKSKINSLEAICSIKNRVDLVNTNIQNTKATIENTLIDYDMAYSTIENAKQKITMLESINKQTEALLGIDRKCYEIQQGINRTNEKIKEQQIQFNKCEAELQGAIKEIDTCPTCGTLIENEQTEYIINS